MPSNEEIKAYHGGVVKKYKLQEKMVFSTEVIRCVWNEEASYWIMFLKDLSTGREYTHMCQILFSAVGQLVKPRPFDAPGQGTFKGQIFHSARWNHSADLKDKNVVVIGNGC
jgi:cation diffusion facilitator CzcD-associated flavoprotein CzcO